MKRIGQITTLVGTTVDNFPQIGWIGTRTVPVSIESRDRLNMLEAAGIEKSDDVKAMQDAGKNVEVYVLIGKRTVAGRQASQEELETFNATPEENRPKVNTIGHVFAEQRKNDQGVLAPTGRMLITIPETEQDVVLKAAPTVGMLNDQLTEVDDINAMLEYKTAQANKTNTGAELASLEAKNRAQAIANQANWKAIQAEKKAAHAKSLTGVDAGAGVPA